MPCCPLCNTACLDIFSKIQQKTYYNCPTCNGVFLDAIYFLSAEEEKARYELHNNDIHNIGYQKFVSPIVEDVRTHYSKQHKGLDYGSGSGPVITSLLRDSKYDITTYDPYFDPNQNALSGNYDYIVCCEVMEHFYTPFKEFNMLHSLLVPGGRLFCKTTLYQPGVKFETWWYKNDPTHVFFYSENTLLWIQKNIGFSELFLTKNLITFLK
ncbi:class I SAM-dependent methyltransferase [Aquimarina hainanensis]|uniref:Class I SAM-dependent methyltransferase n=1 Tax=Aquimarina hainanensis TaxID=1578017 RepID=A0ABW5N9M6_9FLAO|nr:class I SAM-dependent methyltransferase [Aquimarina sp. TRL1]QKX03420.1 class I SAM-dependent methyltransferase [Aquimarina sp. TRL1]